MKKMFKLFTTAVVFMLFTMFSAQAQYRFGVLAGANFADVVGDESSDNAIKTSFHAGIGIEGSLNERYSLTLAALYSVKGTKSEEISDLCVDINYVEFPLAIKYQLENGFGFWVGPYFGILTSANFKFDNESEEVTEQFNDLDAGVKLGLGYRLKNGLGIHVDYSRGLTNIDYFDNSDLENQNSVFGAGLSYYISTK